MAYHFRALVRSSKSDYCWLWGPTSPLWAFLNIMLWIYRRNGEQNIVEIRLNSVRNEYSLRILLPAGCTQFERFAREQPFRRRLCEVEMEAQTIPRQLTE
jgi:hypothetical protein